MSDTCSPHPSIAEKLEEFRYEHLPPHLQEVSRPFNELANKMVFDQQLNGTQVTIGLQKLIEAKDCMVRAAVKKFGRKCNNDRPQEDYNKPWPEGVEPK